MGKVNWFYKSAEAPPLKKRVDQMTDERKRSDVLSTVDSVYNHLQQAQRELDSLKPFPEEFRPELEKIYAKLKSTIPTLNYLKGRG